MLFGDIGETRAYIGESESVRKRIAEHDIKLDWWQTALLITTSSDALHKAHVKYLESRMVEDARKAGMFELDNGNTPPRSSLNPAAVANMEAFLDTVRMVLPALGVAIFQSGRVQERSKPADKDLETPEFLLETPKNGVRGSAYKSGAEFIVRAGSIARKTWASKGAHDFGYKALHAKLLETGVLVQSETHAVFAEDYAFNSPSAAAAVMNGCPANGRIEWKLATDGRSYAEWEDEQLQDELH